MANVGLSLKWLFIVFNIVFAIAGGILILLGIVEHAFSRPPEGFEQKTSGALYLCLIGSVTVVLSIIGTCGAYKEKKWTMAVFFTGMVLENAGLLLIAGTVAVSVPMERQAFENDCYSNVPLDEAGPDIQQLVDRLQSQLKCCGLFNGYQDWGKHIPASCLCSSVGQDKDKCEKINGTQLETQENGSTQATPSDKLVYKESCGPIVDDFMQKSLNLILGVCFGFAIMVFIGMAMSMTLLCRIRKRLSQSTISLNPSPPPYNELHNEAEDCPT